MDDDATLMADGKPAADLGRTGQFDAIMIPNVNIEESVKTTQEAAKKPEPDAADPNTEPMYGESLEAGKRPVPLMRAIILANLRDQLP
jgi:hypothetical protein